MQIAYLTLTAFLFKCDHRSDIVQFDYIQSHQLHPRHKASAAANHPIQYDVFTDSATETTLLPSSGTVGSIIHTAYSTNECSFCPQNIDFESWR